MTQMNETYLYRGSAKEAKRRDELPLWRESHKANIACREAIEDAIRRNFDGINLDPECLTPVLEEYGYKRTEWVLAATLRELKWDGRFRPANKDWATRHHVPQDERHIADITVRSHPAVLDGFVGLYRKAYQKLGLFGSEHCIGDRAEQDYTGKVLVLSPDTLKESYWSQENQLWPMTASAAGPMPLAARCAAPAWVTARRLAGIGTSSSVCWMKNTCRTGRGRSSWS